MRLGRCSSGGGGGGGRTMSMRMNNRAATLAATVLLLLCTASWQPHVTVEAQLILPLPDSEAPSPAPVSSVNATDPPVVNATEAPVTNATEAPDSNATLAPPTLAPTFPTIPIFPPCSICGDGLVVTNPDGLYLDTSCELLQQLGASGQLSQTQCTNMQPEVQEPCACAPNTTDTTTTTAPTTLPVTEPSTLPPITTVDYTTTGQVNVVLYSVSGKMSPNNRQKFEDDLVLFYTDNPPDTFHSYSNWTAQLIQQDAVEAEAERHDRHHDRHHDRRRLGSNNNVDDNDRDLQAIDTLFPLETLSIITAWVDGGFDNVTFNFNKLLQDALQNNATGFVALLQTLGSISNEIYFRPVESIETQEVVDTPTDGETFAPTSAPTLVSDKDTAPVPAPDSGNSGGLSTGAAAGIAVGVLVFVVVVIAMIKSRNGGRPSDDADIAPARAASSTLDEEAGGGSSKKKAAAAAAAAAGGGAAAASSKKSSMKSSTPTVGASRTEESDVSPSKKVPVPTPEPKKKYKTREVMAPAGKLGLILDTIEGKGPVVHRVNDTSPLAHLVHEGDLIIAIDGVDTRPLNASAITGLMVKTAGNQRRLTIESEDSS